MIWRLAAFVWGFAEATVFFLVPDILLTFAVLRKGPRFAVGLAVIAAGAAVAGGVTLYLFARSDPGSAQALIRGVPAIGPDQIAAVAAGLEENWIANLFRGAFTGIPYKIFAVETAVQGISLAAFAALSFPARIARFLAAIAVTALLVRLIRPAQKPGVRWPLWVAAAFWTGFYLFYFCWRVRAGG